VHIFFNDVFCFYVYPVSYCLPSFIGGAALFFLGTYLIFAKKGSAFHSRAGKVYMILMFFTGGLTLFIPAQVGARVLNHFGLLHLLSLLTLWAVPRAWFAIKRGDVKTHKWAMIRLYVGGLLLAGGFAILAKGRYLNTLLFN
jgi:uncharacterized membrane protein